MPRSWSSISSFRTGRPLTDGAWARARMSSGVVSGIGSGSLGCTASTLQWIDDEAGQGLGVDVRALLGHDVAVGGDGHDLGGRGRLEEEGGVGAVRASVDEGDRLGSVHRVPDRAPLGDRPGIEADERFEGRPEEGDVEAAKGGPARREVGGQDIAAGPEDPPAVPRPEPEPALAAPPTADRTERPEELLAGDARPNLEKLPQAGREGGQPPPAPTHDDP